MKIVFMGSSALGIPALNDLKSSIKAIYTRAPKPKGRGLSLQKTVVHEFAESHNIPVHTPRTLRNAEDEWSILKSYAPDFIIVAAYGLILPQEVLDIPTVAPINIHGSLLPRWRGAAPIERAIMEGDKKTGISIMKMTAGIDEGPVYAAQETPISNDDDYNSVHSRLSSVGADLLMDTLNHYHAPTPQPHDGITYAAKIDKSELLLDLSDTAENVHNKVRALTHKGARVLFKGDTFIIHKTHIRQGNTIEPGRVIIQDGRFILSCRDYCVDVLMLQRPGKTVMDVRSFLRGFRNA